MSVELQSFAIGGEQVVPEERVPEVSVAAKRLRAMSDKVHSLEVVDEDSYREAANYLESVDAITKVIESITEEFRKPAYDYYKKVLATKKSLVEPGEEAKKYLRAQMTSYVQEQERIRREEEERLRIEAQKEAEAKAEAELEAALEKGDEVAAELAIEKASAPQEVETEDLTPQVEGVSYRSTWKASLTSIRDLCKAVANGEAPERLVQLNTSEANGMARALKDEMKVPGLKAVEHKTLVKR